MESVWCMALMCSIKAPFEHTLVNIAGGLTGIKTVARNANQLPQEPVWLIILVPAVHFLYTIVTSAHSQTRLITQQGRI